MYPTERKSSRCAAPQRRFGKWPRITRWKVEQSLDDARRTGLGEVISILSFSFPGQSPEVGRARGLSETLSKPASR